MIAVLHLPEGTSVEDASAELIGACCIVLADSAPLEVLGCRVSMRLPNTADCETIGEALKVAAPAPVAGGGLRGG